MSEKAQYIATEQRKMYMLQSLPRQGNVEFD